MEPMTVLALAFQLVALFSIAGALLIYLKCKIRNDPTTNNSTQNHSVKNPIKIVLITSVESALGLQLCTHLANKGCRVFAGMRDAEDSLSAKLLSGWLKIREFNEDPVPGTVIPIQLDVTREDVLREATVAMGAHLCAGERGITAVINTSGSIFRGRVVTQEVQQWEHMLKTNILGSLRVAKAFVGFLRHTRGRLIYLGAGCGGDELVAFNASRVAVEKCAEELRRELQTYGINVIALDTTGLPAEALYKGPTPHVETDTTEHPEIAEAPIQYTVNVLSPNALQVLEHALWDETPQQRYQLVPNSKFNFMLPCRSSLRLKLNVGGGSNSGSAVGGSVQKV